LIVDGRGDLHLVHVLLPVSFGYTQLYHTESKSQMELFKKPRGKQVQVNTPGLHHRHGPVRH
jgi:hypothetical protein